jgi:hypothetical protein
MIISHKDWLSGKLSQSAEKLRMPKKFCSGEEFSLLGERCRLQIKTSESYRAPEHAGGELTVYISESMSEADAARLFERYICELCERCVKQAFDKYIPMVGAAPKKITIKRMTSRWGSCSSSGNISINTDVVCFEQECIDYVVIHELCHLKHMNHGEEFWKAVSVCCPNYKAIRERMKH